MGMGAELVRAGRTMNMVPTKSNPWLLGRYGPGDEKLPDSTIAAAEPGALGARRGQ